MDKRSSSGISCGTVLFLIFLVLKLCNLIDWSWWWVTSPLWISLAITLLFVIPYSIYIVLDNRSIRKKYGVNMNDLAKGKRRRR
jgi:hypothetical protein